MAAKSSPTLRRRELAARLRELRVRADLSVDQVAERLLCSPAKISRIETAARGVSLRDVRDLSDLYGVTPEQRDHMMELARQGKERAWWQDYDIPAPAFVGLEAAAAAMEVNELAFIPALLQTRDYAQALVEGMAPKIATDTVQQLVEARVIRQQLLTGERPLRYWAIVDEGALHRLVGGPAIMSAQLRSMLDQAMLSNITVQVVPFGLGAHPGMEGNFSILRFEEPAVSDVVYVEGRLGFFLLERPTDLDRYRRAFEDIRAVALSPKESLIMMRRAAESLDREVSAEEA